MKFSALLVATALSFAFGVAVPKPQDVYSPPILYPHAGTIWYAGQYHNVTWDNSNPPANISNYASVTLSSAKRYGPVNLTSGFDLTVGRIQVHVPTDAPASTDYIITLFGDSGNISPQFTINV